MKWVHRQQPFGWWIHHNLLGSLAQSPIGKCSLEMEKELEWESSNLAIKTTLIKQQNQRSECLLLTLKQEDQAILSNPRASFMVKSSRNNGESDPNVRLYAWDGREKEGKDGPSFLYCDVIIIGSCLEPTGIAQNHWRFLARTGSDKWPSTHRRC